jgi:hypothetical protein
MVPWSDCSLLSRVSGSRTPRLLFPKQVPLLETSTRWSSRQCLSGRDPKARPLAHQTYGANQAAQLGILSRRPYFLPGTGHDQEHRPRAAGGNRTLSNCLEDSRAKPLTLQPPGPRTGTRTPTCAGCKPGALPLGDTRMVRSTGLEPARRSTGLSCQRVYQIPPRAHVQVSPRCQACASHTVRAPGRFPNAGPLGVEPRLFCFRDRCVADYTKDQSPRRDSNPHRRWV